MTFDISKAPATLMDVKNRIRAPKKTVEGQGAPIIVVAKEIDLKLDLSADLYTAPVDWLIPGTNLVAKEMSGADTRHKQWLTNDRKLGNVSCTIRDAQGKNVLLKFDSAVLSGANRVTISEKGAKREIKMRVVGTVPRELLGKIDEFLLHDVLVDIAVAQIDWIEEEKRSKSRGAGKASKKTRSLRIDRDEGAEQIPLT